MTSATQLLNQSVLVFSRNYLPISRINIKGAIVLLMMGKAEALDLTSLWLVKLLDLVNTIPQHIRLTIASTERVWKVFPVNRREVLKRDDRRCQYCDRNKRLTLKRVIPVSKGGKHKWDNVVAACEPCNQCKRDRTPLAVGLSLCWQVLGREIFLLFPLRTKPKAPMQPMVAFAENFWHSESACPSKETQGQC